MADGRKLTVSKCLNDGLVEISVSPEAGKVVVKYKGDKDSALVMENKYISGLAYVIDTYNATLLYGKKIQVIWSDGVIMEKKKIRSRKNC